MQVSEQFGMSKSLDLLVQLIYLSTNLFSSFEFQNNLLYLKITDRIKYSKNEKKKLLSYFLDLIQYFSMERIHLIQDPVDESSYILSGLTGGL